MLQKFPQSDLNLTKDNLRFENNSCCFVVKSGLILIFEKNLKKLKEPNEPSLFSMNMSDEPSFCFTSKAASQLFLRTCQAIYPSKSL